MKSYFVSIAISIFILSRVEPLYAGNIMTPFGPISDLFYYDMECQKEAIIDREEGSCIHFSQHSENGHRLPDISFSVSTNTPADTSTFTYPQSVIELISALPVDNPSKIALFMVLIILNQNISDLDLLSTDGTGINNIEVTSTDRESVLTEFFISLHGTDVAYRIATSHISRVPSQWLTFCTRTGEEYFEHFELNFTIPPHSMSHTEQAYHNLWRSSCLAGLFMWIGSFFNQSQKP